MKANDVGPDELLSAGQAARLLEISPPGLNYWVRLEKLKPIGRTGNGPIFRRSDVEAFKVVREAARKAKAARVAAKRMAKKDALRDMRRAG